ncbi:MAG: hypothetical protein LBI03_11510, partial [Clostridiales bacterium]|nr:hypothetical protein [Clostridiales bacterium]
MSEFKNSLIKLIDEATAELYSGSLVNSEITEGGFFCDLDLPEPLNTEKINRLKNLLSQKEITCTYELSGISGAYQDGDANKKMLQRLYVEAFATQEELNSYKEKLAKASEHDHKRLGAQLNLFTTSDEIGQGLVLWQPKGAVIRFLMEQFSQTAHLLNGYQWVYTPHIGRSELWKTSGHLENFKDSMYSPIDIDGEEYYLKPMNCP